MLDDTRTLKLLSVWGIPVRIHPIVLLVIGMLLIYQFAGADPEGNVGFMVQGLLLVLACVFVHEAGHALVARGLGIPVADITLSVFYAVTRTAPPPTPGREICVAAAGPAASLLMAVVAWGTAHLVQPQDPGVRTFLEHALLINLLLGLANLLPAFPMDGGRIFRALMQFRRGHLAATRQAVWSGRVLAGVMLLSPLYFGWSPLSFGLPVVAIVVIALGEQELQRALRRGDQDPTTR